MFRSFPSAMMVVSRGVLAFQLTSPLTVDEERRAERNCDRVEEEQRQGWQRTRHLTEDRLYDENLFIDSLLGFWSGCAASSNRAKI